MARRTIAGTPQVNLTFERAAYALLKRYAPPKKASGPFLGQRLTEYAWWHQRQDFERRLAPLEERGEALVTR
jgi:hypothetical protein